MTAARQRDVLDQRQVVIEVRLRFQIRQDEVPVLPWRRRGKARGVEQVSRRDVLARIAGDYGLRIHLGRSADGGGADLCAVAKRALQVEVAGQRRAADVARDAGEL